MKSLKSIWNRWHLDEFRTMLRLYGRRRIPEVLKKKLFFITFIYNCIYLFILVKAQAWGLGTCRILHQAPYLYCWDCDNLLCIVVSSQLVQILSIMSSICCMVCFLLLNHSDVRYSFGSDKAVIQNIKPDIQSHHAWLGRNYRWYQIRHTVTSHVTWKKLIL